MKIEPAPLATNITDKALSQPWMIWLRNLSKNMVDSTRLYVIDDNFSYSLNGNILSLIYIGTSNNYTITLPFPIATNTILKYFKLVDSEWKYSCMDITKGDTSIVLPSGNLKINDQVLIEQKNR